MGDRQYDFLIEYNHAGSDLEERELHDTVRGPSELKPPTAVERELLVEAVEATDREGGRRTTFVPAVETTDGRDPSRRLILDTGSKETWIATKDGPRMLEGTDPSARRSSDRAARGDRAEVGSRQGQETRSLEEGRSSLRRSPPGLSLIHISEPTRPY